MNEITRLKVVEKEGKGAYGATVNGTALQIALAIATATDALAEAINKDFDETLEIVKLSRAMFSATDKKSDAATSFLDLLMR